jgi:hypothetical protein
MYSFVKLERSMNVMLKEARELTKILEHSGELVMNVLWEIADKGRIFKKWKKDFRLSIEKWLNKGVNLNN